LAGTKLKAVIEDVGAINEVIAQFEVKITPITLSLIGATRAENTDFFNRIQPEAVSVKINRNYLISY
jgi:hypothetical protein